MNLNLLYKQSHVEENSSISPATLASSRAASLLLVLFNTAVIEGWIR